MPDAPDRTTRRWVRSAARRLVRVPAVRRLVAGRRTAATGANPPVPRDLVAVRRLIDVGFYSAQVGRKFANRTEAAQHYLERGARRGQQFHPLINPRFAPDHVQERWRAGELDGVVRYLFSERGVVRPWSSVFDPRRLGEPSAGLDERVESVKRFFTTLERETPLPAVASLEHAHLPWGDTRAQMLASARRVRRQRRLSRNRMSSVWDAAAEEAWLAAVTAPSADAGNALVSIVMPVWNRSEHVVTAIASVRAQSLQEWELIVVDDGSTDDTLAVVRRVAAEDPRIVVLAEPHAGASAARNAGLAAAQGTYVAFLDSDNTWRPHFLETMVGTMQASGIAFAYSGMRLVGSSGSASFRAFDGGREHLEVVNHIDLNVLVAETRLAREVGGFDTSLRRWLDHDFALRLAARTPPVLLPFIGCDYDDDGSPASARITTTEHDHWQYVVLGNAHVDWEELARQSPGRVTGRISVVIPTYQDCMMTIAAVAAVMACSGEHDVEVVVVDNDSHPSLSHELAVLPVAFPAVTLIRLPRNLNFAVGSNVGFARSTGEYVVFLNNDTEVRPGWLDPLLRRIEQPDVRGVQPLLLYPDNTIQAAGTVFPVAGAMPTHLLAGHPPEDAAGVGRLAFSVVTAAALLMRSDDVIALRGFDPIFVNGMEDVDLCLRAVRELGGAFAVEPGSVVEHKESKTPGRGARITENRQIFFRRWDGALPDAQHGHYEALGFDVVHAAAVGGPASNPSVVLRRRHRRGTRQSGGAVPSLRWNIKNPAVGGRRGDEWGDTHFIAALADALRAEGQEVVTSRHGVHQAAPTVYDDVNLVIRGLDAAVAQPGLTNVLWVISHPDAVTVDELRGFDLVFAASERWARDMSVASGRAVLPLLQATDPTVFHPPAEGAKTSDDVVFVGQARREQPRQVVMDALAAGVDVKVWGPRWRNHIEARHVQGDFLANERLGSLYRASGAVLNDHWADMAANGFISNRLFDAVASGARVVTDAIEGVEELFDGSVRVYRSQDDLARLVSQEGLASEFADAAARARTARRVGREHSFSRRAEQLLDAVLAARGEAGPAGTPSFATAPPARAVVEEPARQVVYSVLMGGYERLTPQPAVAGDPSVDRILFTDDPALTSDDWEVRVVGRSFPADPGRSSRRPKILAHRYLPDHDVSLYIDNSVRLLAAPSAVIGRLLPADAAMAALAHSYRGDVNDEIGAVLGKGYDADARITEQREHYVEVAPDALSAQTLWGGLLVRRHHDPVVVEAMESWWEQVLRYSRRDQLSLPYALRRVGLAPVVHTLDNFTTEMHEWPAAEARVRSKAFQP